MTSLNNNNTFYLTFKDANPSLALISCASIVGIIALLGIIFNVSVIFVTVKTKAFRDPINYLLALCSFFELLHQQGHFLFVYTAFSGQNFIKFRLATKLVFVSAFGLGGIYPTMFFTGIDRLYVVIFDEMQNKRKIQLYLATITSVCVAFSLELCFEFYRNMFLYGDQMITGSIGDFFKGTSYKTVINTCMMLITGIIYLVVGILIRTKSAGMPSADQINRRAFRALFCIITVNIGGYCIHSICNGLIRPLIQSPITTWFLLNGSGILLNIGAAANGPILYFTSTVYRQAFQTVFPFVFNRRISAVNQIAPQQNGPPTRGFRS